MSSLEEINRNYSNYTSTEKLFAYTSYGAQMGAAVGSAGVTFMATYIFFPCYQKGLLQTIDLVKHTGVSAIVGVFIGGAAGGITATITGAVFLVNDLVYNDYELV